MRGAVVWMLGIWLLAVPCSGFLHGSTPLVGGRRRPNAALYPPPRFHRKDRRSGLLSKAGRGTLPTMTVTVDDIITNLKPINPEELRELLAPSPCESVSGLRCVIVGPPCSGKSLLAPMIEAKYGIERISVYDLVGEEVVDDETLISKAVGALCKEERRGQGFVLHGYPTNAEQAKEMANRGFEVDIVIELLRSDEEAEEWRNGRIVDPANGLVYHETLLAAPLRDRWRLVPKRSNALPAFEHGIEEYRKQVIPLRTYYEDILVQVDASLDRAMVDVLRDVTSSIDAICPIIYSDVEKQLACQVEQTRFLKASGGGVKRGGLLSHVKGLNTYDVTEFLPFCIDGRKVGWMRKAFAHQLDSAQKACGTRAFEFRWSVVQVEGALASGEANLEASLETAEARTDAVHAVVKHMWDDGAIRGWRGEFQAVSESWNCEPLLQLERGAVPYFGVPSYGVHVNVYTQGGNGEILMWVARRAKNKPTYPGLLDQCVAGGQPAGLGLQENVEKECIEEASIEAALAGQARPASAVRYMYETRKGMSPKTLFCYDLMVPDSFVPVNQDGEVEAFERFPLSDIVESLSQHPEDWKPNSALVCLDFAIRKGAISPDTEPDYLQIVTMLRGAR